MEEKVFWGRRYFGGEGFLEEKVFWRRRFFGGEGDAERMAFQGNVWRGSLTFSLFFK